MVCTRVTSGTSLLSATKKYFRFIFITFHSYIYLAVLWYRIQAIVQHQYQLIVDHLINCYFIIPSRHERIMSYHEQK